MSNNEENFDGFHVDENDSTEMVENTDFTDFADKAAKKRKRKGLAIVILSSIIALSIIGAGIYLLINANTKHVEEIKKQEQTVTQEETVQPREETTQKAESVMIALTPDIPAAGPGEVKTVVNNNQIQTTDSKILQATGYTITGASNECSVVNAKDFCYVGTMTKNDTTDNVYFLKDAVHSRLFENVENFQKTDIAGATSSAVMDIDFGSAKKTVIVVVTDNGSGFMIVTNNKDDMVNSLNLS